jgi:type IV pilus assembly protein PilB
VTRLADIGVPPFLIASSVIAIMGQRLVRVNCPKCKEPYTPHAGEIKGAGMTAEQVAKGNFMKGRGCNHCRQTGYRGRQGLFEMMRMTSIIRELTFAQAPAQDIRRKARSSGGMKTLLEDGILKILKGTTTFDEVLSTCHAEILVTGDA